MKVFKFYCGKSHYGVAAKTKKEAINIFNEQIGDLYTICKEIPEKEWDKKDISIWEDNNPKKKLFKISIREAIFKSNPHIVFGSDTSFLWTF